MADETVVHNEDVKQDLEHAQAENDHAGVEHVDTEVVKRTETAEIVQAGPTKAQVAYIKYEKEQREAGKPVHEYHVTAEGGVVVHPDGTKEDVK